MQRVSQLRFQYNITYCILQKIFILAQKVTNYSLSSEQYHSVHAFTQCTNRNCWRSTLAVKHRSTMNRNFNYVTCYWFYTRPIESFSHLLVATKRWWQSTLAYGKQHLKKEYCECDAAAAAENDKYAWCVFQRHTSGSRGLDLAAHSVVAVSYTPLVNETVFCKLLNSVKYDF